VCAVKYCVHERYIISCIIFYWGQYFLFDSLWKNMKSLSIIHRRIECLFSINCVCLINFCSLIVLITTCLICHSTFFVRGLNFNVKPKSALHDYWNSFFRIDLKDIYDIILGFPGIYFMRREILWAQHTCVKIIYFS